MTENLGYEDVTGSKHYVCMRNIIAKELTVDIETVLPGAYLANLADSLEVVELFMELEDRYDIEIPEEVTEDFRTAGDLMRYVMGKLD